MRILILFVATASLIAIGGCYHARRPEPLKLPATEVIGQLHGALSTIDALPAWADLVSAHEKAEAVCKAELPDSTMCTNRSMVEKACSCATTLSCTQSQNTTCATTLAARADFCAAERNARAKLPACRLAASRRVPVFKQADVTLNVARERNSEAGMSVLIFSAGQSQMYGGAQTLKFVLAPRPREDKAAADAGDLASKLQLELRHSLEEAVTAALSVMTAPKFTIPVENGNQETFEPRVYAKEFAVTAEIVRRDGNKFGLSWKDPSDTVGVSVGRAAALGSKNQIVLVFAQED